MTIWESIPSDPNTQNTQTQALSCHRRSLDSSVDYSSFIAHWLTTASLEVIRIICSPLSFL